MIPRYVVPVSCLIASTVAITSPAVADYKTLANQAKGTLQLDINPTQTEAEKDPFMRFNRSVFDFNVALDKYTTKPLAQIYRKITPQPIDHGITSFFRNIKEPWSAINHLLQGHPKAAALTLARFSLNTMTSLGFYDLAKHEGLTTTREDFGQTLATWGMPSGPFLMLPFLGPSTIRDSVGTLLDTANAPTNLIQDYTTRYEVLGLQVVDLRADLMSLENVIQGDKYTLLRDVWLQQRLSDISNGQNVATAPIDDGFGDESNSDKPAESDDVRPESSPTDENTLKPAEASDHDRVNPTPIIP